MRSEQASLPLSTSYETHDSSNTEISKTTSIKEGPVPWHLSVTVDETVRLSMPPPLSKEIVSPLSRPTDELLATEEHSAGLAMSQYTTSSSSISPDCLSPVDAAGSRANSLQFPRPGSMEASATKTSWTQGKYPLQAIAEPDARSLSFQADSEQENEPLSAHVSKSDQTGAGTKTLRRSSRSRRLRENVPEHHERAILSPMSAKFPAEVDAASQPVGTTENEQYPATTKPNPWKRQMYPLVSSASDSTSRDPIRLLQDQDVSLATGAILTQWDQSEEVALENTSWSGNPIQPFINGPNARPVSPPSSGDELDGTNKTPTQKTLDKAQAAQVAGQWHRQKYPLQMPASKAALQHSVTPPPSPGAAQEHWTNILATQDVEGEQSPRTGKASGRQTYPLQSPASVAQLKYHSGSQPLMHESCSANTHDNPSLHLPKQSHVSGRSHAIRAQVYPLQSPASVPALQLSLPSPLSGKKEADSEQDLSARDRELATAVSKHWRRQVYPIQSPENTSPFQQSIIPQALKTDDRKSHTTGPIHLPKHIQAAKDVEEQQPTGRTIIVCLDGTGDKFDNDNSNIVHLISALKKDDPRQVSYYQAGIGTYSSGGLSSGFEAALDMAVGSGLGLHVRDAYHFLMHTYKEGDKICIFGFSRGAYTARCLAGMIHKVGLLPPRNIQQIPFAYEFYAKDTKQGWKESEKFKATFCIDVCVYFLGCFDSVASVGFIPRQLPLSSTPTNKARYFRHAMALDERRAKFKVCRHQVRDQENVDRPKSPTTATSDRTLSSALRVLPTCKAQDDVPPRYSSYAMYGERYHPNVTDEEYRELTDHEEQFDTDVLEVWFAGAHADVGGGAVPNKERHKLAQIPLRWMIRQAFECNTGIIFKTKKLAEFGLDVHTLWPEYRRLTAPDHGPPPSLLEKYKKALPPRSIRRSKLVPIDKFENGERFYHLKSHMDEDWTPEQVEDFYDAISTLNDQLQQVWSWWILEVLPVEYKVPVAPGQVSIRTGMNLGRYREVDDAQPNLHWTALHRARHSGYEIQARTAPNTKWRVVV